jgi:hypothetical protein
MSSSNNNVLTQIQPMIDLNDELVNKQIQQNYEIEEKQKLLETRNRMLQLSYEENIYKKKMLYTLLSILLLFVVVGVVLMIKKKK